MEKIFWQQQWVNPTVHQPMGLLHGGRCMAEGKSAAHFLFINQNLVKYVELRFRQII
jgi:hypothetical protein